MTRQMADDEVLRVIDALGDLARHRLAMKRRDFDKMVAAGKEPHWAVVVKAERAEYLQEQACDLRAAVAALQAERDALREKVARDHQWITDLLAENKVAADRAERAESALEALRGQVAELMKFREGGLPTKGWLRDNDQSRRVLHELNELLAIKERMG